MKKYFALLLSLCMLFSLVACSGGGGDTTTQPIPTYSSPFITPDYFLGYDNQGNLVGDIVTFQEDGNTIIVTVDGRYQSAPISVTDFYTRTSLDDEDAKVISYMDGIQVTDLETNTPYTMGLDHWAEWSDLESNNQLTVSIYGEEMDGVQPTVFTRILYHGAAAPESVDIRSQLANTAWVDDDGNTVEITDHQLILNGMVAYFTFDMLSRPVIEAFGEDDTGMYSLSFIADGYAGPNGKIYGYYPAIPDSEILYSNTFVQQ